MVLDDLCPACFSTLSSLPIAHYLDLCVFSQSEVVELSGWLENKQHSGPGGTVLATSALYCRKQ